MKVRFTLPALSDLAEILDYLSNHSPAAAERISMSVTAIGQLLAEQPGAGKRTSDPLTRQMALTPYPYVLFYEWDEFEVIVVAVRHGARDPRSMPGAESADGMH